MTRIIYKAHVSSFKNRFAIRILRPETKKGFNPPFGGVQGGANPPKQSQSISQV